MQDYEGQKLSEQVAYFSLVVSGVSLLEHYSAIEVYKARQADHLGFRSLHLSLCRTGYRLSRQLSRLIDQVRIDRFRRWIRYYAPGKLSHLIIHPAPGNMSRHQG